MNCLDDVLQGKQGNYIAPFFWQHGEDEKVLRDYMKVIYEANIRAVCIESRPHPDFCGEKWWKDMDALLDEAKRLGMKIWILDDSHFPTGFANGDVKNAPAELHHQYMVYRSLEMCGPAKYLEIEIEEYMKPEAFCEQEFMDDELLAVLGCKVGEEGKLGIPFDLTSQIKDGILRFGLEDGYWKIFIVYLTRNAKGRNDYINFMDKDSCRLLLDAVYEPHYEHYKEYFGTVIAGFFSDEPPVGNVDGYIPSGKIGNPEQILPWSKIAGQKLAEKFGSDNWKRYIPFLWADASDDRAQANIRNAYMDMVTELVEECFSRQNGKWCEEHGVEYIGHMLEDGDGNSDLGPSMGHFFRGLFGQHMAGIDNIGRGVMLGGQNCLRSWSSSCSDEAGFYHYLLGKMGVSHAAIDRKKKGRCMCENFGAYGWQTGTKAMKYMTDHFMVRGVNFFVPHAFSPAPFPDPDCPPHFYAHGENPLYRAFGKLMAYTNRVCHLINGGRACPDVAILYNANGKWAGEALSNIQAAKELTQAQLDFHVIPSDVFDSEKEYETFFDGKKLVVNQNEYNALIISGCNYLEFHAAKFAEKAIEAGYPVLFTEYLPKGIIGAAEEENQKFRELVKKCVVAEKWDLGSTVKKMIRPEITLDGTSFENLTVYHYQNGCHVYLLMNEETDKSFIGTVYVKTKGKALRYYPWENEIVWAEAEQMEDGSKVKLEIKPLELCVLIFEESTIRRETRMEIKPLSEKVTELFSFQVTRVEARGYHGLQLDKEQLYQGEIIEAPFEGMQKRYPDFSGYYFYETEVMLDLKSDYWLEIEDVSEAAEVFVDDTSAGMLLQKPFAFHLPSDRARERCKIRIETATTLERRLHSRGVDTKSMSASQPLSPTGILGKVIIKEVKNDTCQ